jgi:hypothetical protein
MASSSNRHRAAGVEVESESSVCLAGSALLNLSSCMCRCHTVHGLHSMLFKVEWPSSLVCSQLVRQTQPLSEALKGMSWRTLFQHQSSSWGNFSRSISLPPFPVATLKNWTSSHIKYAIWFSELGVGLEWALFFPIKPLFREGFCLLARVLSPHVLVGTLHIRHR